MSQCDAFFPYFNTDGQYDSRNFKFGNAALAKGYTETTSSSTSIYNRNQGFGLATGQAIGAGVNSNIAIGANAMPATITAGSFNVGIGQGALLNLASGTKNVAIGAGAAGNTTVAGNNNVAIGADTQLGANVSYSVALGNGAQVNYDNTIVLGGPTNVSLTCSGIKQGAPVHTALTGTWYYERASRNPNVVGIVKSK